MCNYKRLPPCNDSTIRQSEFYSILFYSIPFHFIPFNSIPFHSIILYSIKISVLWISCECDRLGGGREVEEEEESHDMMKRSKGKSCWISKIFLAAVPSAAGDIQRIFVYQEHPAVSMLKELIIKGQWREMFFYHSILSRMTTEFRCWSKK